ncbi:MAG TPA: glycosyltransferase family 9 protein [bacterium]|nr:glycosyltransferase family 9 protein [bacterium]
MKRILVVKLRPLGDVVVAGPKFEAIRRAFPKAWITALVQPPAQELLRHSGWANEVFAYHRGRIDQRNPLSRAWRHYRLVRALWRRRFDLAVDFSGAHRSAQIVQWSGASLKLGLGLPALRGFYDQAAPAADEKKVSPMELDARVLGLLGLQAQGYDRPGGFWPLPEEARRFADSFFKANRFEEGDLVLAVNPFASCPSKEWYPEKWAAVIIELLSNGFKIFFTCAPLEKKGLKAIEEKIGKTLPVYAGSPLTPLLGLYRRCHAVLSVDSGPRHIAAAVGAPTLTVWGPEPVGRWHPYSPERHPLVIREIDCRPCGLSVCVARKHECMTSLQPQDLVKALKALLKRTLARDWEA